MRGHRVWGAGPEVFWWCDSQVSERTCFFFCFFRIARSLPSRGPCHTDGPVSLSWRKNRRPLTWELGGWPLDPLASPSGGRPPGYSYPNRFCLSHLPVTLVHLTCPSHLPITATPHVYPHHLFVPATTYLASSSPANVMELLSTRPYNHTDMIET